tara:strand:- start:166 stop:789 length:624 start_codon:yes stop_codon:yes gene_type:complete
MILKSKICGVSDSKILNFIVNHDYPPEFIGFIVNYPKSKRYVDIQKLKELMKIEKKKSFYVAVLVNPDQMILDKIKDLPFDYYQLYDVDPKRSKEIKNRYNMKIISALTISNQQDVEQYEKYSEIFDIILFDSKGYHNSESFNHSLLDKVPRELNKMIAGNIQINDIPTFKNKNFIIDISGALEDENGNKDINKIDNFLNKVHNVNH